MADSTARRLALRSADSLLSTLGIDSGLERKFVYGGSSGGSAFSLPDSGGSTLRNFNTWSLDRAIKSGYEATEAVYACVNAISRSASTVPWRVSEFTGDTQAEAAREKARFVHEFKGVPKSQLADWMADCHTKSLRGHGRERKAILNPLPDDPVARVLENPNPEHSREEFIERAFQHIYIGGEAIWSMVRGFSEGGRGFDNPIQLWPLMINQVEILADGMKAEKYLYHDGSGSPREFDPKDIMHFRLPDPKDPLRGISPLAASAASVDLDVMAARWQLTTFSNRGIPDMLFAFDEPFTGSDMGRTNFETTKRDVQDQLKNSQRNALVIGNRARVQQLSLTPQEVDYIRSRGFTREGICSVYDVFPAVIKIQSGFSMTAVDDIMRQHWLQTVIPALQKFQSVINRGLVPQFASRGVSERFAWFDTSNIDVLVQDYMEKIRAAKIVHTMGVPFAEINRRYTLGFDTDSIVGSEMGFFPAGVITAEQALAGEGSHTGSGNMETAPEGGDNPANPNVAPPEDVIPDDPGEGIPDTQLSGELDDLEKRLFTNGDLDPHQGKHRWTEGDVYAFLELNAILYREVTKTQDHFLVDLKEPLDESDFSAMRYADGDLPDVECLSDLECRFYHGELTQSDREWLLKRTANWGF